MWSCCKKCESSNIFTVKIPPELQVTTQKLQQINSPHREKLQHIRELTEKRDADKRSDKDLSAKQISFLLPLSPPHCLDNKVVPVVLVPRPGRVGDGIIETSRAQ